MTKSVAHLRSRFAGLDQLRYVSWRLMPLSPDITLRLKSGERIAIRRPPEPDLHTAYEVFAAEDYVSPRNLRADSIERIIDVGANIGCTVIRWCHDYPSAHIDAVEPHPRSCCRLIHNVKINGFEDRVTIYPFAVGSRNQSGVLNDDGLRSSITTERTVTGITVRIVDFYELVGNERVDLLKLDCEGGEYEILMDPRFDGFRAQAIVMEWHNSAGRPSAAVQIVERLAALGWCVEVTVGDTKEGETGVLWAYA